MSWLPFPPKEEQTAIATFLDRETGKIDALIAEQEKLLTLLAEKRQATISHAVTKGLNPDAPMKDSGVAWLGEVPEHWGVCSLRRVVAAIEQGWSPECHAREAEENEWGVLKAGCLNGGVFRPSENKALPPELSGERNRVEAGALPKQGVLVVDTSKADVALDRQRTAIDAVRYGRAVNPLLGDYIVAPEEVPVPIPTDVNFIQSAMDENKRDAVLTAMSEAPLMLVQGPPGAGKTTFITEVVLQTLRRNPQDCVLEEVSQ